VVAKLSGAVVKALADRSCGSDSPTRARRFAARQQTPAALAAYHKPTSTRWPMIKARTSRRVMRSQNDSPPRARMTRAVPSPTCRLQTLENSVSRVAWMAAMMAVQPAHARQQQADDKRDRERGAVSGHDRAGDVGARDPDRHGVTATAVRQCERRRWYQLDERNGTVLGRRCLRIVGWNPPRPLKSFDMSISANQSSNLSNRSRRCRHRFVRIGEGFDE